MSFHSDLVTVLPGYLVTLGVVSEAAAVYFGRSEQAVTRTDGEVWVERLPSADAGDGFQARRRHAYLLHVRVRSNKGSDQAGAAQLTSVEAKLRTLVEALNGQLPSTLLATLTGLVCVEAQEDVVDEDPEDAATLTGAVRLTFVEAA